jgi:copper resistance protein B
MMKKLLNITLITLALSSFSYASMGDDPLFAKLTIDELEYQDNDEKNTAWDANLWIGYDLDKLYFYSEGEKPKDGTTESENQLVYSRAIAPYWDIQFGVGYDKTENDSQTWGVVALQGLAPYFFETRGALLIGESGNVGLRLEAEYEALLTQKLILTPSIATDLYSKDNVSMGLGKGLSNITAGARLRYEIRREFAPYVGVEWSKNFGNTADISPLDEGYAVAGVRVWF